MKQEARLPDNKLKEYCRLLHDFYKLCKVTLKELQSLLVLLNFTCSVVVPGHTFLCRMIDLTKGARRPHHHICLTKEVKHDIAVWLTFLEQFNGGPFPCTKNRQLRPLSTCTQMQPDPRDTVISLVSIGFAAHPWIHGNP